MQVTIIVATFVLGVIFGIVAVIALFKNVKGGEGSLEMPGGIKISGKGAPIVFLLVSAVFVLSGFGWAATQKQVVEKDRTITSERQEKTDILKETATLHTELKKQAQVNEELKRRLPAALLQEIRTVNPDLLKAPATEISPALKARLAAVPHH